MAVDTVTIVRSLHLLFAILWGGGSLYHGMIVAGGFLERDPEARRGWWTKSRFGPFLGVTSLLTLVFGLWTYYAVGPESYGAGENAVLGIGMAAGGIGVIIGWAGHLPTAVGLARAVRMEDTATLEKLERRERVLDQLSLIVVVTAVLCMATFRIFA